MSSCIDVWLMDEGESRTMEDVYVCCHQESQIMLWATYRWKWVRGQYSKMCGSVRISCRRLGGATNKANVCQWSINLWAEMIAPVPVLPLGVYPCISPKPNEMYFIVVDFIPSKGRAWLWTGDSIYTTVLLHYQGLYKNWTKAL